jgi:AraC family transcriptional regulator of adaptative response / DNA-3-methyladenine glycosylase II
VAQTRRLHFAKKFIDETTLPMYEVAIASGFGCVRRFNAAIRSVYHRTPTQIRRLARQSASQPVDQYVFRLLYRPPYHWDAMLGFLAPRATPGVEAVEGGVYSRSISLKGSEGYFEVSADEPHNTLIVRVQFPDPRWLFVIIERIRAMFDLNADWTAIVPSLTADPLLNALAVAEPGLRVPGCWDGFELATRAIVGQQVSVPCATTIAGRIAHMFGKPLARAGTSLTHTFPSAAVLVEADLTRAGLTRARAETVKTLARAVADGQISFQAVADSETFLERLREISGVGNWTAQYVAMRALGEPDAFPAGDRALLRALELSSPSEMQQRSEAWRPWRAYATMYLWRMAAGAEVRASAPATGSSDNAPLERSRPGSTDALVA